MEKEKFQALTSKEVKKFEEENMTDEQREMSEERIRSNDIAIRRLCDDETIIAKSIAKYDGRESEEDVKQIEEFFEKCVNLQKEFIEIGIKLNLVFQKGGLEWSAHIKIFGPEGRIYDCDNIKDLYKSLVIIKGTILAFSINSKQE